MHAARCSALAGRRSGGDRRVVLCHSGGNSYAGLYASQERRRVYHDLVLPTLPLLAAVAVLVRVWCIRRIVEGLFASFEQAGNANAERTTLRPAAVSEWRVVWRGSGEMPVRVCSIESSTVPGDIGSAIMQLRQVVRGVHGALKLHTSQ